MEEYLGADRSVTRILRRAAAYPPVRRQGMIEIADERARKPERRLADTRPTTGRRRPHSRRRIAGRARRSPTCRAHRTRARSVRGGRARRLPAPWRAAGGPDRPRPRPSASSRLRQYRVAPVTADGGLRKVQPYRSCSPDPDGTGRIRRSSPVASGPEYRDRLHSRVAPAETPDVALIEVFRPQVRTDEPAPPRPLRPPARLPRRLRGPGEPARDDRQFPATRLGHQRGSS